jgi:hypothetical protein
LQQLVATDYCFLVISKVKRLPFIKGAKGAKGAKEAERGW